MIKLTSDPDLLCPEGHSSIKNFFIRNFKEASQVNLFYVKRKYLGGLDKNLSSLNDLLHAYYLAHPKRLDELLECLQQLKIRENSINQLMKFKQHIAHTIQQQSRVINWKDNIERELLLGDLIGKFNDIVHVKGITKRLKLQSSSFGGPEDAQ